MRRALTGIALVTLGTIGLVSSATVAGAAPPPATGELVLDEPMGNDPALNGTVSYVIADGTITFTINALKNDGSSATVTEVQYCDSAVASAFSDWDAIVANTCAGNASDFPGIGEDDPASLTNSPWTFPWDEDEPYWTVHVDASGYTLYSVSETVPDVWSLTVAKTVSDGLDGDDDDEFAFTVSCTNHTLATADSAFSLGDDDSKVIGGIPDGSVCTVSETGASGWTTMINGQADVDRSIAVTMDANRTVNFANSREGEPSEWDLTITKSVSDRRDGNNNDDEFDFSVSCTNEELAPADASFSLGNDDAKTIAGISDGSECTVSETGASGWSTTINGQSDPDRSITVTMDEDRTLAFANRRNPLVVPERWDLTITKAVSDGVDNDDANDSFAFAVACPGYTLGSGDAAFALGDDGSKTIKNIPDDTVCTVTETATGWSTAINGTSDADRSVSVTMDRDRTVAFFNSRLAPPPTWMLTVTKAVSDAQDGDNANDSFGFTLSCSGHTLGAADATFQLGNGGSKSIAGIPDGSVCTLSEQGATGWTTTINGTADADRSIDVAMTANATVAYANSRPAIAPAVTPAAVKGVQVARPLPRTGADTAGLAGLGAALVLTGVLLLIPVGRRRTAI